MHPYHRLRDRVLRLPESERVIILADILGKLILSENEFGDPIIDPEKDVDEAGFAMEVYDLLSEYGLTDEE